MVRSWRDAQSHVTLFLLLWNCQAPHTILTCTLSWELGSRSWREEVKSEKVGRCAEGPLGRTRRKQTVWCQKNQACPVPRCPWLSGMARKLEMRSTYGFEGTGTKLEVLQLARQRSQTEPRGPLQQVRGSAWQRRLWGPSEAGRKPGKPRAQSKWGVHCQKVNCVQCHPVKMKAENRLWLRDSCQCIWLVQCSHLNSLKWYLPQDNSWIKEEAWNKCKFLELGDRK